MSANYALLDWLVFASYGQFYCSVAGGLIANALTQAKIFSRRK